MSLLSAISAAWPTPAWADVSVLVAVSGGPDSVALLRALTALKLEAGGAGKLCVAHFHHRLRGPEADEDARFVAELARRVALPYQQGEADVRLIATQRGDGIEAAAREARYAFLRSAAERYGARYVVTGHTFDDQIETVLFNILRGTGLSGVAGMTFARPLGPAVSLVRPMLNVRCREVVGYLEEIGQPYRTDSTNARGDFARSRLRQELLPLLRERFNPDIDNALDRLSALARDAHRVVERMAEEVLDRCVQDPAVQRDSISACSNIIVNLAPLAGVDRHLVREAFIALWRRKNWPLQDMGFAEWDALAEMATTVVKQPAGLASRMFPGNVRVQLHDGASMRLTRAD